RSSGLGFAERGRLPVSAHIEPPDVAGIGDRGRVRRRGGVIEEEGLPAERAHEPPRLVGQDAGHVVLWRRTIEPRPPGWGRRVVVVVGPGADREPPIPPGRHVLVLV